MGRFVARLRREGVVWPRSLFQFVIVLPGVYLTILSERKAGERNLQEGAEVMVLNVLRENRQRSKIRLRLDSRRSLCRPRHGCRTGHRWALAGRKGAGR